jgi:hypothetical protein
MSGSKKQFILGLLLIFLLGQTIPAATAEIKWEKDFQASLAKAKADKKPILLDFFNPK